MHKNEDRKESSNHRGGISLRCLEKLLQCRGWQTFSTEGHIEDFVATEGRMLVLHI